MAYIAFSYLALFCLGVIDNSRGPLYPHLLEFFQITKAQGALIFSLSSLSSFLITIPAKEWLTRLGVVNSTRLALVLDIVACYGMASVDRGSFVVFLVYSFVFGISTGIKSIALNLLINKAYHGPKKRQVFSGLHSMYGISSLMAPVIVGFMLKNGYGWKEVMAGLMLFPGVLLIAFLALKPFQQRDFPEPEEQSLAGIKVFPLRLIFGFYVVSEVLLSSRMVVYLEQQLGRTSTYSNGLLTLFFIGLLAGRIVFALVSIPIPVYRLMKISVLWSTGLLILGLHWDPVFLSLTGFTMSFFFPCAMDWLGHEFHGRSNDLIRLVMQAVGAALVGFHYLFGLIASSVSLKMAMYLPLLLSICVFLLLQFTRVYESNLSAD